MKGNTETLQATFGKYPSLEYLEYEIQRKTLYANSNNIDRKQLYSLFTRIDWFVQEIKHIDSKGMKNYVINHAITDLNERTGNYGFTVKVQSLIKNYIKAKLKPLR